MLVVVHDAVDTAIDNKWMTEAAVLILVGVAMVLLFAKLLQKHSESKLGEYVPIRDSATTTTSECV